MDAKDEIKQRLSIEEVVGDYIELKRAGRNLKALSPFTNEKTASFMVSPEKQIWHDFSSGQGGDIFSFVMLMEGVDFVGSMDILARKAGVDLSQYRGDRGTAKRKERLYEELELAAKYYQQTLIKNKTALSYVTKTRGYGKKTIENFQIGYAPSSGSAMTSFLAKRKYTTKEIKDAGLSGSRGDMFRSRIMIPLADGQGRIIGFTGRVLDDSLPKYINTPQTLVYDKGRHVFGLHLAKEAIRKNKFAVVVEGNLDVIASHQAGVSNVVASAGTAMTKDHLNQLSRLSTDIRLAFDSDDAGIAATERTIPIAQEVDVKLSIIDLKGGKDPDELIKHDPAQWKKAIKQSEYVIDWLMNRYKNIYPINQAEGKKKYSDKVLAVLSNVADPVEQDHYIGLLADELNVSKDSVSKKLNQVKKPTKRFKKAKVDHFEPDKQQQQSAYQDLLLGLNLKHADVRVSLKNLRPSFVSGKERQKLLRYIIDNPNEVVTKTPNELREIDDYVKIVLFKTEELYDEWSASDRMIEAIGLARRLMRDNQQKLKEQLSDQIKEAEDAGDENKRQELLEQFDQLLKES